MCDAFNNANDKIINIVCDGKAVTNNLTGKIVCDVPTKGNDFACIIVFFLVLLYVFLYLSARRSHMTSFCRACVPGGHIPDGFWVVWEGPPYRPHSLGDGFERRHRKWVKNRLYSTDAYQCYHILYHIFCRIRSRADIDRMRIRMRIISDYGFRADSEWTRTEIG